MLLAPVVWVLTVVICYFFVAKTWWFPMPINAHGIAYDERDRLVSLVALVTDGKTIHVRADGRIPAGAGKDGRQENRARVLDSAPDHGRRLVRGHNAQVPLAAVLEPGRDPGRNQLPVGPVPDR